MIRVAHGRATQFIALAMLTLLSTSGMARSLPDFVTLAKTNSPAVVNISTIDKPRRISQKADAQGSDGQGLSGLLKHFLEQEEGGAPHAVEERSLGSGFIIRKDGYILTNWHVIEDADRIRVRLSDRRTFDARVIGSDKATDVALIKIDAHHLPTVKIGKSRDLRVGQWVLAIGSPFGFDHTVTAGIVSAKGRSLPTENYIPFIQTDVAINPGNSGGPLFNLQGKVVGINSQIYSRTGGFMGLSFAIPIDLAMDVARQLREHGSVSRGYLGVLIQDVSYGLAQSFGLQDPRGALITKVLPGGPAAGAGLRVGDIIVAFDGLAIRRAGELPPLVGAARVGSVAKLQVIRKGKTLNLAVHIARLSRDTAQTHVSARPPLPKLSARAGLHIVDLSAQARKASGLAKGGALIAAVDPGVAQQAGFEAGDVVKTFAGRPVRDAAQLGRLIERAKGIVPLLVLRDGEPLFIPLRRGG